MPASDQRRVVAELLGWRVWKDAAGYWRCDDPDGLSYGGRVANVRVDSIDEAWSKFMVILPDWPHSPAAALGLLAGVYWQAEKLPMHGGDMMHVRVFGVMDARLVTEAGHVWHGTAKIVNGDEAAAFAAAATEAWVGWKRDAAK